MGKHQIGERKGSRGCSGSQRDFCSQLIGKALLGARKSTQRSSFQSAVVPQKQRALCVPVVPCAGCVLSTHSTTKSSLGFGAALLSASDVDSARNELCDACAPFRSFKNLCRQRNCKLLQPARTAFALQERVAQSVMSRTVHVLRLGNCQVCTRKSLITRHKCCLIVT